MAWICDKNGNHRCEIKQLSYNGTFMEVSSITVTVESPAPIAFAIGDYIDWDYDGLRYTLDTAAGVEKQARRNSVGNAFLYENLVFLSPLQAAQNADFFDVILGNTNDFLTNTEFSFYGTAWDYAKRLEANLCRLYGSGTWKVRIWTNGTCYDATPATGIDTGAWENKLVDVSGIKCLGGFQQIYDLWGCAYVFSVVNGVNYVDFYDDFEQYAKTWQEGGMDKIFAYGKGNGLYKIRHTPDADHVLVTRLRPYGSGDNLPPNYYLNSEDYHVDGNESSELAISHLMLPASQWTKDGVKHPANAYLEQNTDLYGVREGVVLWDGSDPELGEIKPSIYGLTIQDLLNLMASGDSFRPDEAKWPDTTQRIDKIITGAAPVDNGVKNEAGYDFTETEDSGSLAAHSFGTGGSYAYIDIEFDDLVMGTTPSVSHLAEFRIVPTSQNKIAVSFDVQASIAGTINAVTAYLTPYVAGVKVEDATYPCWVSEETISRTVDGITYTKRYNISLLDSTGNPIVFSTLRTGAVTFRFRAHIDFATDNSGFPYLRDEYAVDFDLIRGNKAINGFFSVTIPQIGFDLSAAVANGAKLCMRSGANQPREFQIVPSSVRYLPDTDTWYIRCKRSVDQSISTYFPNSNAVIAAGDEYYFTGITMPPLYVEIAAQKLLEAATAWLPLHSKPRMLSAVDVDNKVMAVEEIVLKEGMSLPISDTDLDIQPGTQESRIIDNIRIEEGSDAIRTFSVTLRYKKEKSSLDAAIRGATSNLATNSSVNEAVSASVNTGHGSLAGRDMPNQHPISAITGLEEALLSSGFFELGSLSGLVQLRSNYDYLGPRKGLIFGTTPEADVADSPAHLMLRNLGTAANPNYALYTPYALITGGDQIVGDGTPGGGGGGGANYLYELNDIYHDVNKTKVLRPDGTTPAAVGDVLQLTSLTGGNKWAAVPASSIGRIYEGGTGITITGNTISLTSGVATAGTYRSVTVDTYGRVTAGTNPTTLSGYGITDAKFGTAGTDYVPITLGGTTKNVLTAHQSLSAYLTSDAAAQTYQPKDADLTAIAGLSGTIGLLKKTAANTWTLDTTTYVPTSRTVNSKALSSNITLSLDDVADGSTRKLSNYLPLAGGTITGTTTTPLTIKTSHTTLNVLGIYYNNGTTGTRVGYSASGSGAYLQNTTVTGNPYVNIASDGVFKYNNSNVFWHDGNDGTGSGLDADLLDGLDSASYLPVRAYDYTNGFLVRTRLSSGGSKQVTVFVRGYPYSGDTYNNINTQIGVYISTPTGTVDTDPLLGPRIVHYGQPILNVKAFFYNGRLYFWFQQPKRYTSVYVDVRYHGGDGNYAESITNEAMPTTGVTRLTTFSTGIVTYNSLNSNTTSVAWSAQSLTLAGAITGATTISASGLATVGSLKIGDATITWVANSGNGYLKIDKPLLTEGDQIVGSGTPGGGGTGGANYLYELVDVYSNGLKQAVLRADNTPKANGDVLTYNSTKDKWVAAPTQSPLTAGTGITISNNVISVTANTYLPLSGGTLSSSLIYSLSLNNEASGATQVGIRFQINSTEKGLLYVDSSNRLLFYDETNAGIVYHSRNFIAGTNYVAPATLADYLPLAGGTMTGALTMNFPGFYGLYLNNNASGGTASGIRFQVGGTTQGAIYVDTNHNLYFHNNTSFYTVWHSGNASISNSALTLGTDTVGSSAAPIGYATQATRLKRYAGTAAAGGYDLNTMLSGGGITSQYSSGTYWANGPTGMRYGGVAQFNTQSTDTLSLQLAWDVVHDSTAPDTGNIWFRDKTGINSGTWGGWKKLWHDGNSNKSDVPWTCSTLTASEIEIGHDNEINGISAGAYTQNVHLNYRSTGNVTLAYGGGNVGIGTNSPSYKLDLVAGVARSRYTHFYHSGNSENGGYVGCSSSANVVILQANSGYGLRFYTNGTLVGNWNTSGNLTIGATDLASTTSKLYVDGVTTVAGNILPSADDTYNLGSASRNWYSAYIKRSIEFNIATGAPIRNNANGGYLRFFVTDSEGTTQEALRLANNRAATFFSTLTVSSAIVGSTYLYLRGGALATNTTTTRIYARDYYNLSDSAAVDRIIIAFAGAAGANPTLLIGGGTYTLCDTWIYGKSITFRTRNGSSNVDATLSSAGVFTTAGDQVISSDITLKTNLQDVKYTIEDIAKTRAVTFDWKDGRGKSAGSIAQDWKPLIPELVHGEEGDMTLAYGQIALVNSILLAKHETEQDKEIARLKKRVRDLEKQLQMRN